MATLSRFRPATVTVEGQPVRLQIRRFKLEEAEAYRQRLREFLDQLEGNSSLTQEQTAFVRESIEGAVTLAPDALDVDGQAITTGAQFLDVVGDQGRVVLRTLIAIGNSTAPSDDEGKPSASESALVPSSDERNPAPHGETPAPTADAAAPAGTVTPEAATEATDKASSGSMGTSS